MESSNVRWGSLPVRPEHRKLRWKHRIGTRMPPDARTLCWLFAAYLMNRCDIGSDGKTPLQSLHGRRDNTPILEFGEKILYMPAKPARGGKWEPEAELVGGSGCHRVRNRDQDTLSERQENP